MPLKIFITSLTSVFILPFVQLAMANSLDSSLSKPESTVQFSYPQNALPQKVDSELPIPAPLPSMIPSKAPLQISIVIDDLGDNSIIARQLLSLSSHLTAAILPHTPHARDIAEFAAAHGQEVIMHLPMEAFTRPDLLGPGALFADMDKGDLQDTLVASAASVPKMVGFNNHMGSMLTEDSQIMAWVMESAKQHGWYFLDSKTSDASVAETVAENSGIPTIGRDIFLDHHDERQLAQLPSMIRSQFEKAKKIARLRGQVVIICHPYPQTLAFLQQQLPLLDPQYQLVSLSSLLSETKVAAGLTQLSK